MIGTHGANTRKLDCLGTLFNILFLPGGIAAFLFFLCQRLDGENSLSFFLLMLPVWISAIPLFAYIILNGIAARNTRINKCEKLMLSLIVPCGFLVTLILLMVYVEGGLPTGQGSDTESDTSEWLGVIFVPHFVSLLCLYLYLRCLVRPIRVHNVSGPV